MFYIIHPKQKYLTAAFSTANRTLRMFSLLDKATPPPTYLLISRPSGLTRYCTIHWQVSLLLDRSTSTVAIHSSVSTLKVTHRGHTLRQMTTADVTLRFKIK